MKKIAIVFLAVVVLMIAACGGQQPPTGPSPVPTTPEPTATEPAITPSVPVEPTSPGVTPVEPPTTTEPAAPSNEVTLEGRLFSQTELTVQKGTTLTIRIVGGTHVLRVNKIGGGNAGGSKTIRDAGSFEFTFNEAGTYDVVDAIAKGHLKVTVQ